VPKPITLRRHLAAAAVYVPAMVLLSLPQFISASQLYDEKNLDSDITADVLGMAIPVDPNLSNPKTAWRYQGPSHDAGSVDRSDDESDSNDDLSSPVLPRTGASSASNNAVYSGSASGSIGSYVYGANDAVDLVPEVVPANLVASFPTFNVQDSVRSSSLGNAVDDLDSSGNSSNSDESLTTGGDWEAVRTSILPPTEFGSPSEDPLADSFGNRANYGFYPGANGYFSDTGGSGISDLLHPASTNSQKDGPSGGFASTAEPEGAGIAVVALILIFIAFYRRSSRRARSW
jgi:hypothetical protein